MNIAEFFQLLIYVFTYSFARYFLLGGFMFATFYLIGKQFFSKAKIQQKETTKKKINLEIKLSITTLIIYGLIYFAIYFLAENNWNRVYFNFSSLNLSYSLISFLILVIFHETWFYWLHRLIHRPKIFAQIHKYHHLSNNPSPFSALAMHPVEGLVEAGYLLVFSFLMPIHIGILLGQSVLALFLNMLWHSGYEIFPKFFGLPPFFQIFNNSTHHNLHHQRPAQGNFSLFLNFWDLVIGTNNVKYKELFEEVKNR